MAASGELCFFPGEEVFEDGAEQEDDGEDGDLPPAVKSDGVKKGGGEFEIESGDGSLGNEQPGLEQVFRARSANEPIAGAHHVTDDQGCADKLDEFAADVKQIGEEARGHADPCMGSPRWAARSMSLSFGGSN